MSLNSLKLLITKLEQVIQAIVTKISAEAVTFDEQEIVSLFNSIAQELKHEQSTSEKYQLLIKTFIRHVPLAVAIVDQKMNYLAISDRWITDFQLESVDLIGQNHYEIFPEIPYRWRKNYEDCLNGKAELLSQEEDFFVRESGNVDWLCWQLRPWHDQTGQIGGLLLFSEIMTDRKLLQQKIESTEGQMRAVFAGMNEFVFTVELNSDSILILPTRFFEFYDSAIVDQIIVQTQNQLFDSAESGAFQALIHQVLQHQEAINFEYSLQLDDSLIWLSVKISPISDSSVIWIARDVTNRKETEEDILHAEKELAQVTLRSIGDGVITTDAYGSIKYLNPIAEHLTGWETQAALGKSLTEVFCLISESTQKPLANPINRVSRNHKVCKLAAKNSLISRNGIRYEIEGVASPIMNRHDKLIGTVIVFRDVTNARKLARKLSWQATHDPLTKLYNRRKFEEYAAAAIREAHLHKAHHVLCYFDLDRFKIVNDTCGHTAGDKLLQQITGLLKKRIRNTDIFARLGGDEFGILFHQCPIDIALDCANQLRKLIEEFRFIWHDKVFRIGISVGLVGINSATEDLTSLLNAVDAACYAAKQQGGNYVHLGDERDAFIARQVGERQWIEKIHQALEKNHFCLYVQKIVSIEETFSLQTSLLGDRRHYEILLRLRDESGNVIPPGAFLPAAERYGLMPAIDRWVISNFFASYELYCQSFLKQGLDSVDHLYTINLSGASINNQEFGNFLREQFDRYLIPPQTICFEITETVAITNLDNANTLIRQLKELGCSIALDDFGSGMSSLTYLKNLPIDYLKIDGSFVINIARDKIDYATVECFNHISQIMNIKTIAEFVENPTILESLKQIGVNYAQGYGIEKPKPLNLGVNNQ